MQKWVWFAPKRAWSQKFCTCFSYNYIFNPPTFNIFLWLCLYAPVTYNIMCIHSCSRVESMEAKKGTPTLCRTRSEALPKSPLKLCRSHLRSFAELTLKLRQTHLQSFAELTPKLRRSHLRRFAELAPKVRQSHL